MGNDLSLFSHLRPFLKKFILALFFLAMVAFFTALFAVVIQPIIDEMFIQGGGELSEKGRAIRNFLLSFLGLQERSLLFVLPQLLLFTFLGQALFSFLALYTMKTLGLKVVRNIRDRLFRSLIRQSVDFISRSKSGDLTSRITNDIEKIKYAVSETLSVYVREILTFLGLLGVIFYQDHQMALVSLVIVPVAAAPLIYFGRLVKKRGIQSQETVGELSSFLSETTGGHKIVKAFNMEEAEISRFRQLNQKHYGINSKIALVYSLSPAVMELIGGIVAAAIFTIGTHRIASGLLSPGQFSSFLAALFLMYNPLKRLSSANNDFQQGKAGYERVLQIVRAENTIQDCANAVEVKEVKGRVEFNDISFSYLSDTPVVLDVNLSVKPAELVALVGASGAGKTTLMNLLLRFYDPDKGVVLIDDRDIRHFTLKSLREHIGLVTQDVFLFNDTVANNISCGRRRYTPEDIRAAASVARASDFINALPEGFDTLVGERGVFLSTGQRQRISIARAIIKQPSILIFDEATSALDAESESLIQEAMFEIMRERTTFVIAHRLSTIIEADRILVLKSGRIVESGNHRELLKKRGAYYDLYNLQFPEMGIIMEK